MMTCGIVRLCPIDANIISESWGSMKKMRRTNVVLHLADRAGVDEVVARGTEQTQRRIEGALQSLFKKFLKTKPLGLITKSLCLVP